jgi:hypothetical protein
MLRLFLVLLAIVGCALKIGGAVSWPWAVVLAPIWVPLSFLLLVVIVTFWIPEER